MRKKSENKKGFTLAELLVVMAIVAVLVAIAIPIFGQSLEKAREATDAANVRAAYATLAVDYLEKGSSGKISVPVNQTSPGWQTSPAPKILTMLNGVSSEVTFNAKTSEVYKVIIDSSGNVSIE